MGLDIPQFGGPRAVPNILIFFSGFLFGLVITIILVFMASISLDLISLLASFTANVSHGGDLTLHDIYQVISRVKGLCD